jgi:hypothetical protein
MYLRHELYERLRSRSTDEPARANELSSSATSAYIVFGITGTVFLSLSLWLTVMIMRGRAAEKRKMKRDEARDEELKRREKPQLHSDCIPRPGPHEAEDKQIPYEAENMGSEKVELPAVLPAELYGDATYEPVEVDAGSVREDIISSDNIIVND